MSGDQERTIKIRAAILRKKLLRGVPPDSTLFTIINNLSDQDLIDRDDAAQRERCAWIASKKKQKD